MKRPFLFAAGIAAVGLGVSALTAEAQVYPTPTTTTVEPVVPAGECDLVGVTIPEDDAVIDHVTVIVRCGISDTSARLFELPLDEVDLEILSQYGQVIEDFPNDGVTVH